MSYAAAGALQRAIFEVLSQDSALGALVGNAIHDEMPPGAISGTLVSLGAEEVRDFSDQTDGGSDHRFTISVVSDAEGFSVAKAAAGAVSDALVDATPVLQRGRIVSLRFLRARARRTRAGQTRRIDLTFRAIVEDS